MASVNKVILIGNLGRDPEITSTKSGTPCARFSVATTTAWKDRDGVKQEKTEWHDVIAWDKLATICGDYLRKGKQVYVEGSLQTRTWEDNGQKHLKTEIKANNVVMLGPRIPPPSTPPTFAEDMAESRPVALDDEVPF